MKYLVTYDGRWYVRRRGKKIRLRTPPGVPGFGAEYDAALARLVGGVTPVTAAVNAPHPKGTFGWLGAQYFVSRGNGEFLTLDEISQRRRRTDLEACFKVPLTDSDPEPMGNCPLKHLSPQMMKRMIEMKDGNAARTTRRKHLSVLCAWGVENKHLTSNPVRDIKAGRAVKTGGYYTWTIEDVQQFLAYHNNPDPRSRKACLALGLLLFGGMRRQDMVVLGKQHCKGDVIRYIPQKTIKLRRRMSQKPLLPVLKRIIDSCSDVLGDLTLLVNGFGKPFTPAGFSNWFRDRCDDADLPQCTPHGLKKSGATIAAENGATTRQLMAMFDWDSPQMAEVYTRAAEQKKLAGEAMFLISLERTA